MPVIAHEAVHVGWWAARYARDMRVLRRLIPTGPGTESIDDAQEELCAIVVDKFVHTVGVRLANEGIALPPFDWNAVGGRPKRAGETQ